MVGEFALHLDCSEGYPPAEGDVLVMVVFGQPSTFEILRVSAYRHPEPMGSGWATHFVRLRQRVAYLEE